MAEKRNYRLVIEYDGTRFAGWQVQPDARTVQGVLEAGLAKITRRKVRLYAAGRTDAGVHAAGQVAHVSLDTAMDPQQLARALNGVIPRDVSIVSVEAVPAEFSARFDATARTYRYTMTDRRIAIGRRYAWHVKYPLDRELLAAATRPLKGEVNLRGFSKGPDGEDYTTVIFENDWRFDGHLMIFEIRGIRFFHHAVRSIVGSAVEVARGRETPGLLERVLATRDRSLAGPTAPACGLCLTHVAYGEER